MHFTSLIETLGNSQLIVYNCIFSIFFSFSFLLEFFFSFYFAKDCYGNATTVSFWATGNRHLLDTSLIEASTVASTYSSLSRGDASGCIG